MSLLSLVVFYPPLSSIATNFKLVNKTPCFSRFFLFFIPIFVIWLLNSISRPTRSVELGYTELKLNSNSNDTLSDLNTFLLLVFPERVNLSQHFLQPTSLKL